MTGNSLGRCSRLVKARSDLRIKRHWRRFYIPAECPTVLFQQLHKIVNGTGSGHLSRGICQKREDFPNAERAKLAAFTDVCDLELPCTLIAKSTGVPVEVGKIKIGPLGLGKSTLKDSMKRNRIGIGSVEAVGWLGCPHTHCTCARTHAPPSSSFLTSTQTPSPLSLDRDGPTGHSYGRTLRE
jgi:hypothetical protein